MRAENLHHCWVLSGGIPSGARTIAPGDGKATMWLKVCVLGQHLPQMYREDEIHRITPESAPHLGLCPDCLGWGTQQENIPLPWPGGGMSAAAYPHGIDERPEPCPVCEGSGRPALRSIVTRDGGQVNGRLEFRPHEYVPPRRDTMQVCLACGSEQRESHWHE